MRSGRRSHAEDAAALRAPCGRTPRGRSRRPARGARSGGTHRADPAPRRRLRLHRAHRARRDAPRPDPRGAAAEDRRRRRPRSRIGRRGHDPRGPRARGAGRDPRRAAAGRAGRAGARPRISGGVGRPSDADGLHRRAAVLGRRAGDRLHARRGGAARRVLHAVRGRCRPTTWSARWRSTGCSAASGRRRSPRSWRPTSRR